MLFFNNNTYFLIINIFHKFIFFFKYLGLGKTGFDKKIKNMKEKLII